MKENHSHCDAGDAVRSVPEADVARVRPALWRPPRHYDDEDLDEDEEDYDGVPRPELGAVAAHALMAIADHVEADCQREVKQCLRVSP